MFSNKILTCTNYRHATTEYLVSFFYSLNLPSFLSSASSSPILLLEPDPSATTTSLLLRSSYLLLLVMVSLFRVCLNCWLHQICFYRFSNAYHYYLWAWYSDVLCLERLLGNNRVIRLKIRSRQKYIASICYKFR